MKHDVFHKELNLITNNEIRQLTISVLEKGSDYFYTAPASSTGKYHPECTLKKGGIIIHTRRAVYIGVHLCKAFGMDSLNTDRVISAIILHDICKTSSPKFTPESKALYENHPINGAELVQSTINSSNDEDLLCLEVSIISEAIKHHMGLWTPASDKKPMEDYSIVELIVYFSDYLSSRKDLSTPVDNEPVEEI